MSHRIFDTSGTKDRGKDPKRGASEAQRSLGEPSAASQDASLPVELIVDDATRVLDAVLSDLTGLRATQAVKERGWAKLARELDRHPVRPASSPAIRGTGAKRPMRGSVQPVLAGRSRGWRVALGSAGAAVAIVAVVLGVYSAGLLGGDASGPVASATTAVSVPAPTDSTEATGPVTTDTAVTVTTEATGTTTGTTDTTPDTTESPPTSDGAPPTSGGSAGTSAPPTTEPLQTTTTNEQHMAAAQREKDAEAAALDLADAVVRYFWATDGDLTGLRALVATSAQGSLTQMVSSLDEPSGYTLVGAKTLSDNSVRITLQFTDVNDSPRFFITVRVDDGGVTITAISAGS